MQNEETTAKQTTEQTKNDKSKKKNASNLKTWIILLAIIIISIVLLNSASDNSDKTTSSNNTNSNTTQTQTKTSNEDKQAEDKTNEKSSIFSDIVAWLDSLSTSSNKKKSETSKQQNPYSAEGSLNKPWISIMNGNIYSTKTYSRVEEFKADKDISAGTYLFCKIPDAALGWISIKYQGSTGTGGGDIPDGEWATMKVKKGQTLLASGVAFCKLSKCNTKSIKKKIKKFEGSKTIPKESSSSSKSSKKSSNSRYTQAINEAESIKEQYPNISWSSLWEEMQDRGYTYDEIAWAIGG